MSDTPGGSKHAAAPRAPRRAQPFPGAERLSPMRPVRRIGRLLAGGLLAALVSLAGATWLSMRELPDDLRALSGTAIKAQVLARDGSPLSVTRENDWNTTDTVPLASIPALLQTAFIVAEDQHFYAHHGVDWTARGAAFWEDLRAGAPIRGASTITEQVVHLIHPRPRTPWSRWVAGFEAAQLETRVSKAHILEFYLNQVPYSDRRRGVVQAARGYFDRGLDTLLPGEQLALAVLVRSPSGMDLRRNAPRARRAVERLADRLQRRGDLTAAEQGRILALPWVLNDVEPPVDAGYFVRHVLVTAGAARAGTAAAETVTAATGATASAAPVPMTAQIRTTLDPDVQRTAQGILDGALADLDKRHVQDGGMIVIDHQRNEVLGWVVSHHEPGRRGAHTNDTQPERSAPGTGAPLAGYDTVLTPRQPGSTMKPLLYALALEHGWTAATLIDDAELSESVGGGQHTFHNYSHRHYGPLRLREALGNSLNIPAVKALKFVGGNVFLERLHAVGITSLTENPDFYGDGLALGNGEVSLFEMAQAYTVLARGGRYHPLRLRIDDTADRADVNVFAPAVASLIANIIADPEARLLEFGHGLQFPVETAIKTGTSTDYRDAWAIAFDYRHTVAVWMGNLDGSAMDGVTGAVGPAMVLRSLFSELNRDRDTLPLPLSRDLVAATICRSDGRLAGDSCETMNEWFLAGTLPGAGDPPAATPVYRLLQPTAGLQVAHDPRIPDEFQKLSLQVAAVQGLRRVDWYVDDSLTASTASPHYPWPLQTGVHRVKAQVWTDDGPHATDDVRFYVR